MISNNTVPNESGKFIPTWLRGSRLFWVASAGAYSVIFSLWVFIKWTDPAYELLIAGLGYLPLGIFAAICASLTANQKQLDRSTRRAWLFIALSAISLSIGDILYAGLENTVGVGFPDIPDFFYLLYYPLAFIGLILIPTRIYDPSQQKTWRLDLAIMVVSATSVLWYFIIEPTAISGGESWSAVIVAGAYPAMDMLLLASIASIIFRRSEVNTRYSLRILSVGLLFYVVADIVYAWQVLQNSYVSGTWLDLLWTFSYFFVGLAALRQSRLELVEVESANKPSINRQVFLIPFVALGVSVAASLYAASTGDGAGPRTNGLVFGTALAVILTLTRQVITIRENALLLDDLNLASDQLRSNAKILEERVAERTKELESQKNRLRIAAQITKDSTSARDLESLLERSTRLILDQFMMYHVAIFLLDQKKEFAILTSSPTEAGRQMIANGHKLRVGETGIVGRVAAIGEPRIAFDVNQDDVHFNNPLLPDTRSEMALPLKVETRIVGVLDIQSSRVQAFNEDDIAVMQIIAEQLAIAIEHTQLLQQVEVNFRELEQAYGRSTRESWMSLAKSGLLRNTGYRFDNVRIQPITTTPDLGMEAIRSGQKVMRDDNGSGQSKQTQAAIPVKLRGQAIGVVTVKLKEGYSLNTINTIEQAVDRLAASLESARLFEEARSRADREQAIAQVSAAISSAGDFDTILRTTVEEIGKSLGDSEVSIQIISETGQA